eukprot:3471730-Amphidinium_carterae.1
MSSFRSPVWHGNSTNAETKRGPMLRTVCQKAQEEEIKRTIERNCAIEQLQITFHIFLNSPNTVL